MPKKAAQVEETPVQTIDPQKKYLIDQFGGLMEQVGEGFGGPLQEELIRRLEQTIADFHEEVTEMLTNLRDNSEKRHEQLKEIWNNPEPSNAVEQSDVATDDAPNVEKSGEDLSDWEKRLEGMDDKGADDAAPEKEEKPKKKGFFGRKKK